MKFPHAAISFAVAFATYAWTAPNTPGSWDTAEMQTAPWILGIPHPTGFPVYVLAGWLFTHVMQLGSVAWRMNVFSGLCMAVTAAAVCQIALTLEAGAIESLLGALLFTWCAAAWNKGSHADPHAMSLMFIVLVLLFAVRYGRRGVPRDLIVSCACAGLGVATHPEAIFCFPAIAIAALTRRLPRPRLALAAFGALVVPLAFYAYLPLRSAYVAAHGLDPLALAPFDGSHATLFDTNHTRTFAGFMNEVSGSQFGASGALMGLLNVARYPEALAFWWQEALPQIPRLEVALAVAGAIALLVRDVRSLLILATGALLTIPFVDAYRAVEGDVDRYFMPSYAVLAVAAAFCARIVPVRFALAGRLVASVLLSIAAIAQWNTNNNTFRDRFDTGSRPLIDQVARYVPDGSILVTAWVDSTSLAYGSFVERTLGSRIIVTGWPGEFKNDYATWVKTRPVYLLADPNTYPNVLSEIPESWRTPVDAGADTYHHVIRVIPHGS